MNESTPLRLGQRAADDRPGAGAWALRRARAYAAYFPADLVAGLTVGSLLVPQSMAYALLAGLPPEQGLYTSLLPLLAYAALGSSSHLAVGPVSVICVLIGIQLSDLNVPADEQADVAALLAAIVGVLLGLLGLARLGFIQHLLSHSVLSGFMSGVALVIALEQLDALLGVEVDVPRGHHMERLVRTLGQLPSANVPSLLLSGGTILGLVVALVVQTRRPSALWPRTATLALTVIGTLLTWGLKLDEKGVDTLGVLHVGLPTLAFSPLVRALRSTQLKLLLPKAALLTVVGFVESIAVGKTIAARHGEELAADAELLALGAANAASAISGGFAAFGSLCRTPVNHLAGAATRGAGVVTAMVVLFSLAFLMPFLQHMPKPVAAAIIVVAVLSLVDLAEPMRLLRVSPIELGLWLLPFVGTLAVGIEAGLLGSLSVCALLVIRHASLPFATLLLAPPPKGLMRLPRDNDTAAAAAAAAPATYSPALVFESPVERHTSMPPPCMPAGRDGLAKRAAQLVHLEAGSVTNGLPLLRLQSPLFFANASQVRTLIEVVAAAPLEPPARAVLVDMHATISLDSSALVALEQAATMLRACDASLALVRARRPVMIALHDAGLRQDGCGLMTFATVDAAVAFFQFEKRFDERTSHRSTYGSS